MEFVKRFRLLWLIALVALTVATLGSGWRAAQRAAQRATQASVQPTVQAPATVTSTAGVDAGQAGAAPTAGAAIAIPLLPSPTPSPSPTETAPPSPTETAPPSPMPGPTPGPAPVPAASAAPSAQQRLADGERLERYGDYVGARAHFAALLADPSADPALRDAATEQLVKAYLAEGYAAEALALLDEWSATPAADPTRDRLSTASFLRAVALTGLGRHSEAIAAYQQLLQRRPQLAEVIEARVARAYLAQGDGDSAVLAFRRAADATPERVARVQRLEALAQALSDLGRYTEAVAAYDEILSVAENGGYRADIQVRAGQALAASGDVASAIERWRAATAEAPASKAAYAALVELVDRQVDFDLYQRGYIDLAAGAYLPAINAYQAFLASAAPDDARRGAALHELGQSYLGAEDYAAAVDVLNRVPAEFPECECVGQAWLDKARAQAALGDGAGARRTYRTFAREAAEHPLAPEALWRSGLSALNEGAELEAAGDLLALADAFPASERTPLALYVLGLGLYQKGLFGEATNLLARLQESYPDYRGDAVGYWLGRAHQANGEQELAHTQWRQLMERAPDTYFGVLAAQSTRQPALTGGSFLQNVAAIAGPASRLAGDDGSRAYAERWLADWLQIPAATLTVLPDAIVQDPDFESGHFLLAMDERGDALPLLERVYRRHQDEPPALYALSLAFEEMGAYRLSLLAMTRLLHFSPARLVEDAPIYLQQRVYPRRFDDLITREAYAHNLDPLLLFSLIRQESLFEEGARSVAAAQGLAQIIPDTGAWVAERLSYPNYENALVYRPAINVKFGAYYLDWARTYLDGNLVSALVGYNAGPGNSSRWRGLAGEDDALFVELLEYTEPRVYNQTITSNLYHYTRLYGP